MIEAGNICENELGEIGIIRSVSYGCSGGACHIPRYDGEKLDGSSWFCKGRPNKLADSFDEFKDFANDDELRRAGINEEGT